MTAEASTTAGDEATCHDIEEKKARARRLLGNAVDEEMQQRIVPMIFGYCDDYTDKTFVGVYLSLVQGTAQSWWKGMQDGRRQAVRSGSLRDPDRGRYYAVIPREI